MKFPRPSTLHVASPIGQTLALAIPILLLFVGALELVFRVPAVESRLPAPNTGSHFATLDVKLHLLDHLAEKGQLDCVFIGSSVVNRGLSPQVIEDAYAAQTGETIHCFNFGVGWTTASGAAVLAHYVIDTYHPRLLIYGVTPRDFSPGAVGRGFTTENLRDVAWIRYTLGIVDLQGWLLHHSAAYRYRSSLSQWLLPDSEDEEARWEKEDLLAASQGQTILPPAADPLADIQRNKPDKRYLFYYADYVPLPAELAGLRDLVALNRPPDVQVIVVEVPLHPVLIANYMGLDAYRAWVSTLETITRANGVVFWPTYDLALIPANDWQDPQHLNKDGADVFSRWFGDQLGAAVKAGEIAPLGG
jgi:hypothetical protein